MSSRTSTFEARTDQNLIKAHDSYAAQAHCMIELLNNTEGAIAKTKRNHCA